MKFELKRGCKMGVEESNSRIELIFVFSNYFCFNIFEKIEEEACLKYHYNPPRTEHVPCGPPAQMIEPNGDDEVNIQFLQPKYLRVQNFFTKSDWKVFFDVFFFVRLFTVLSFVLTEKLIWSESVKFCFKLCCLCAWMNSRQSLNTRKSVAESDSIFLVNPVITARDLRAKVRVDQVKS